jgi:hypothetical protein
LISHPFPDRTPDGSPIDGTAGLAGGPPIGITRPVFQSNR